MNKKEEIDVYAWYQDSKNDYHILINKITSQT